MNQYRVVGYGVGVGEILSIVEGPLETCIEVMQASAYYCKRFRILLIIE